MRQFIAIFAAFLLMPVLIKGIPLVTKKKPGFGPVLLITGVCLALIAGLPADTALRSFTSIFTTAKTVQIIVAIILVGVLGNLLKQYGFLDKIVAALETLIPSKKAILMVLPAVAAVLILPRIWEVTGIWLSIVVAEFMAVVLSAIFLLLKRKKYHY